MGDENALEALASILGPLIDRQKAMRYGAYGMGLKHDVSGSHATALTGYVHGPGGLLTFPGVDQDVFSATMGPKTLLGQIPTNPSLYTDPTFWTITGVQDDVGSEKSGICDDAPTGGLVKACLSHSVFGRYERATREVELNRLGARTDRGDPLDLRLVNSPFVQAGGVWGAGPFDPTNPNDVLTNEMSKAMWERNVSFYRLLAHQIWSGNPTANAAGGGYKEMTGLDILINTGYHDVETTVACPAMDSYVANFNHGRIDASGSQIVAALSNVVHQLKFRADRQGVNPVRWVIAMRAGLFYELTSIWPCSYLSYRCAVAPGMASPMQGVIDAQDAVRLRDEMRAGNYLLIDGERFEVITDDGIVEENGNNSGGNFPRGCFESDIYIIPMSIVGGRAVTYMEYFQYANPSLQDALGNLVLARIEGAFLTWPRQTNQCVVLQSKIEPRLILRTPWLAGRLQNVVYCPIEHTQDVFPDDPYFRDGGRTGRPGPSFTDIWEA